LFLSLINSQVNPPPSKKKAFARLSHYSTASLSLRSLELVPLISIAGWHELFNALFYPCIPALVDVFGYDSPYRANKDSYFSPELPTYFCIGDLRLPQ